MDPHQSPPRTPPPPYDSRPRSQSFGPTPTINLRINVIQRRNSVGSVDVKLDQDLTGDCSETVITIPTVSRKLSRKDDHRASKKSNFDVELSGHDPTNDNRIESPKKALMQLIFPFLVAGMGNVAAGILLDRIQKWEVFSKEGLPQLMILVPALLGLKGNVEMTLASRLSTYANLGHLDRWSAVRSFVSGNLALVQCQATSVGSVAPFLAIFLGIISGHRHVTGTHVLLIVASSVVTTSLASFFDGVIMCIVVVACRKLKINPDNIATPLAASLGDITELSVLAFTSNFFFNHRHDQLWIPAVLLSILLVLIPLWARIARLNEYTRKVVVNGWVPIVTAMVLQVSGGTVMEKGLEKFEKLAQFQPVINGIGGNIASIQSSRLSTWLHMTVAKGQLPKTIKKICIFPGANFIGKDDQSKMARFLLMITAPSHFLFMVIIRFWERHSTLTFPFVSIYLSAALVQVTVLLYIAHVIVLKMWQKKWNPDNFALPFITAIADLFGSMILGLTFLMLYLIGDPNGILEEDEAVTSTIATTILGNSTVYGYY